MAARADALRRLAIARQRALPSILRKRSPRRPGDDAAAPSPAKPRRPSGLSGGAAAALEFGE